MLERSRLLRRERQFEIWEVGKDRAGEVTFFIYRTYFSRFQKYDVLNRDDLVKIAVDDIETSSFSRVFAAQTAAGRFLGCIRIIEKTGQLPVERDFSFDAVETARRLFPDQRRINRIFEIGRFATSTESIRAATLPSSASLRVTDCLLREMFTVVSEDSGNIGAASLDTATFRILGMRGIRFQRVDATEALYIGSPTIPVVLPVDSCRRDLQRGNPRLHDFYFQGRPRAAKAAY